MDVGNAFVPTPDFFFVLLCVWINFAGFLEKGQVSVAVTF